MYYCLRKMYYIVLMVGLVVYLSVKNRFFGVKLVGIYYFGVLLEKLYIKYV